MERGNPRIRVSRQAYGILRELAERWNMTMLQVVDILVQEALKTLEPRKRTNEANTTETTLVETLADSPVRQAVAETLYLTEPVMEILSAIVSVYPDLKAECSLPLEQLRTRFVEVAESWGFLPASEPTEQPTEERTEQPQ
jgi:hypothetical protein